VSVRQLCPSPTGRMCSAFRSEPRERPKPGHTGPGVGLVMQSMEDTFTLFLEAMVVTQSSICLMPLMSKVFNDRVSVESGSN